MQTIPEAIGPVVCAGAGCAMRVLVTYLSESEALARRRNFIIEFRNEDMHDNLAT